MHLVLYTNLCIYIYIYIYPGSAARRDAAAAVADHRVQTEELGIVVVLAIYDMI